MFRYILFLKQGKIKEEDLQIMPSVDENQTGEHKRAQEFEAVAIRKEHVTKVYP